MPIPMFPKFSFQANSSSNLPPSAPALGQTQEPPSQSSSIRIKCSLPVSNYNGNSAGSSQHRISALENLLSSSSDEGDGKLSLDHGKRKRKSGKKEKKAKKEKRSRKDLIYESQKRKEYSEHEERHLDKSKLYASKELIGNSDGNHRKGKRIEPENVIKSIENCSFDRYADRSHLQAMSLSAFIVPRYRRITGICHFTLHPCEFASFLKRNCR
jgi:hypothetical protein